MVDTLSQNEIDALLSALQPSEDAVAAVPEPAPAAAVSVSNESNNASPSITRNEAPQISSFSTSSHEESSSSSSGKSKGKERKYDFKRQTKFSKEQLGTIQLIHESFARLVGTDISTRLRMGVTATILSVTQETFEEFIGSIFPPTFITIFRSDSLDGEAMLQMDLSIVFSILDRLLGGNGAPLSTLRQLTDVEKQIMQKIMIGIIDRLREAWINVIDLMPVIELVESNPQFAQIVPPNDVVVTIKIEISILDTTGNLKLCIPYNTVETITHKLNAASWFAAVRKESEASKTNIDILGKQVKNVVLPVVAELGRAVYPLEDLVNLHVGDYLLTNQLVKEDLNIRVGNQVKFHGRPGILGKKMAISITKVLEPPGQEEDE